MRPQSTILLVEDNAAVTAALCEVLSFYGYRLLTAGSIHEADKALLCLGTAQVHLVISDIHLTRNPDVCEGYAFYQRWTLTHPSLPFILISAFPSSRDLPAVRAQAVRFLEKPFEIEDLLHCVQDAIGAAIISHDKCPQGQTLGL